MIIISLGILLASTKIKLLLILQWITALELFFLSLNNNFLQLSVEILQNLYLPILGFFSKSTLSFSFFSTSSSITSFPSLFLNRFHLLFHCHSLVLFRFHLHLFLYYLLLFFVRFRHHLHFLLHEGYLLLCFVHFLLFLYFLHPYHLIFLYLILFLLLLFY